MSEKKLTYDGYQPMHRGFQPAPVHIAEGHQPIKVVQKPTTPQPPPKKP